MSVTGWTLWCSFRSVAAPDGTQGDWKAEGKQRAVTDCRLPLLLSLPAEGKQSDCLAVAEGVDG